MQRALHLRMNGRESDPGEPVFMSRSPWLQPLESGHFVRIPVELVLVPVWGFVRIRMQVCIVIARPTLEFYYARFCAKHRTRESDLRLSCEYLSEVGLCPDRFFFSVSHVNKKKGKDKLIIQSIRFGICRTISIFFE